MSKPIMVCLALLLATTPARAAFYANYTDWQRVSASSRMGFVAGIVDWLTAVGQTDPDMNAAGRGIHACAAELRLGNNDVAEAITDFYKRHTDRWVDAPAFIFWDVVVRGICLSHVNKERAARGLNALEKAE
jgi:hypothetical protein